MILTRETGKILTEFTSVTKLESIVKKTGENLRWYLKKQVFQV